MAYVTDDKRVKKIIKALKQKAISVAQARTDIKSLSPRPRAHCGYLDWEVQAAIESATS